jgi:PAS domain S-box-containing protein
VRRHGLETYEEVLRATRGHFLTSEVTRDGFRQFVASLGLAERYPGIQGVGYAEVVPPSALAAHVARVRAEGFPDYAVRPPGERATYTAIVMLEPFVGRNLRAFGFDMSSEPVRRAALERSIALDDITTSGKVKLVQETEHDVQAGFLMYAPVFAPGAEATRPASGSIAETKGLRGWVYAPFRMNDLMAGVLGERADDLEIELFDGDTASMATQLYARRAGQGGGLVDERFHAVQRLEIAHHTWTMSVRPTAGFAARLGPDRSAAFAATGVLCSLLLVALTWSLTNARGRAIALAEEREGRYRSFLDIGQDGIHLLDEQGNLVEANQAFLQVLGRPASAIGKLNARDWDVTIPAERMLARIGELLERPSLFRTRHRRADGIIFDVEVHAGPIVLEGKRHVLASSRDVTARVVFEREIGSKQAQLEELNRSLEERIASAVGELRAKDQLLVMQSRQAAMGEMIGNIAHQWRQPLNALGLVLANLRDAAHAGELDAASVDASVGQGWRFIEKMSTTISDFRDFFRPGREKAVFSALAQVRETLELIDASFRNAGIELEIEPGADATILGFANEYSQILLNLLSNARQAIETSGVAHGRVTLRLTTRDGFVALAVRDNGGGIPAAILDRIFEPYFSTKEAGTGIGLYMSRQIVERSLGGRLELANVEGGAQFTVLTPIAPSAPSATP